MGGRGPGWNGRANGAGGVLGTGTGSGTTIPTKSGIIAPNWLKVSKGNYGLSTEYPADNAIPMPSMDQNILSIRRRQMLLARGGRTSTSLASGTGTYGNTFFGQT